MDYQSIRQMLIEEAEAGYECEVGKLKMISVDKAVEIVNSQPPADRPEPKRGKWIRYEDTHENSVKYICPFCGDYTAFRGEIAESTVNGNYIYCRHCGAKNGEDQ